MGTSAGVIPLRAACSWLSPVPNMCSWSTHNVSHTRRTKKAWPTGGTISPRLWQRGIDARRPTLRCTIPVSRIRVVWINRHSASFIAWRLWSDNSSTLSDTQLADRTATVVPTPAETKQRNPPTSASKKHQPSGSPKPSLQDALAASRADLTEAQRSRADLQDRLARVSSELEKHRKRSSQDSRRMNAIDGERTQLQLRLKDRDEELRGKAKLLDVS